MDDEGENESKYLGPDAGMLQVIFMLLKAIIEDEQQKKCYLISFYN